MKVILGLMLTFGAGLYQASTLIGSGAGAWVCERSDMKGWVKLVDLYEAEKEFQLKLIKLPANLSYQDIVDRVSYRFRKINSDLAEKFEGSMSDVLAGLTFVDSDLQIIDD